MPSNYNTIIINQPFGMGDIVFIQSIANDFVDEGYKLIMPVEDIYASLNKHFPNVTIVDRNFIAIDYNNRNDYVLNGVRVIPMRFSDSICGVPYTACMKSKYFLLQKDWTKWKDNCKIVRDTNAENKLFYDVLKLNDGEPYNLISQQFTTGGARTLPITVNNGLRNVELSFVNGFTHIDWLKVYQNATNIHAVSSSNIYLFELFDLSAKEVHLYIRRPHEKNHDNYKYILTKNYILHN